jgi:hypothetical protein
MAFPSRRELAYATLEASVVNWFAIDLEVQSQFNEELHELFAVTLVRGWWFNLESFFLDDLDTGLVAPAPQSRNFSLEPLHRGDEVLQEVLRSLRDRRTLRGHRGVVCIVANSGHHDGGFVAPSSGTEPTSEPKGSQQLVTIPQPPGMGSKVVTRL